MLTGFLPAPCSLWALSKEMPQNSASFKWICRSGRSVFFLGMWLHHNHRRCTLLSCSSRSFCVCASFEMGPDLNFPVTIPTSTCMRCQCSVCGFVARWGSITICVEIISSTFLTVDIFYIVSLNNTKRYAALLYALIAVCRPVGHPTGGVCINAVISKWHGSWDECFEWECSLRWSLFVLLKMQIIKIDLS